MLERGKKWLEREDLEFMVGELTELNLVFTMHFKEAKYFQMTTESWILMWEEYVGTLEKYATNVVQRPDLPDERAKTVDGMVGKLRFILMDMDGATTMPPMPLLTRGMLTSMIQSIREVSAALNEVSNVFVFHDCILAGRVCSTCEVCVIVYLQVKGTRLARFV